MKNLAIVILILFSTLGKAQSDSSAHVHKNAGSIEMGGTSFAFFGYGSVFNFSYHRFFPLKGHEKVKITTRIGFGTFRFGNSYPPGSSVPFFTPIEFGVSVGHKIVQGEFGLAYTAVFGGQSILHEEPSGFVRSLYVTYYDFVNVRIGAAIVSKRRHFPYARIAWMPIYVPKHNPYPIEEAERLEDHFGWRLLWGGVSIGAMF